MHVCFLYVIIKVVFSPCCLSCFCSRNTGCNIFKTFDSTNTSRKCIWLINVYLHNNLNYFIVGFYVYIESSSPRQENDVAMLQSPGFTPTTEQKYVNISQVSPLIT